MSEIANIIYDLNESRAEVAALLNENGRLRAEVERLKREKDRVDGLALLADTYAEMRLPEERAAWEIENAKLKSEVERLKKRVAELELESGRVRVSPLPDALIELRGAAELEQFGEEGGR